MNNSEALKRLKESAKQQSDELKRSVTETHQESLKQIVRDLNALHDKRLKAMQKRIDEELEKPQPTPWALLSIIGATTLIVGLIGGAWGMKELRPAQIIEKPVEKIVQDTSADQKLIEANRQLQRSVTKLESRVKELQAWYVPDEYHGTTEDGKKWLLTSETQPAENGKTWALIGR